MREPMNGAQRGVALRIVWFGTLTFVDEAGWLLCECVEYDAQAFCGTGLRYALVYVELPGF